VGPDEGSLPHDDHASCYANSYYILCDESHNLLDIVVHPGERTTGAASVSFVLVIGRSPFVVPKRPLSQGAFPGEGRYLVVPQGFRRLMSRKYTGQSCRGPSPSGGTCSLRRSNRRFTTNTPPRPCLSRQVELAGCYRGTSTKLGGPLQWLKRALLPKPQPQPPPIA
jgi:hypothetical protein